MAEKNLTFDFTSVPAPLPAPEKPKDEGPRVLSVGEFDRVIKRSLDRTFAEAVWVEGEVTGARPAASGHMYFCLKDEREEASIDVVVYKSNLTPRARKLVADGARIRVRGKPDFWAPRGRLQLVGDRVDAAGRGALLEALEKLKARLAAEGLFAPERKRRLPAEPRVIGVVTSAGGAAIHDVCRVAFRRGGARILLAPALVQGAGAAESIARAVARLAQVSGVDVIIVGRGGGSADDLAAFNEEIVVRAVASCRVPVVSAVGHEIDVTLTDFAADARAATPSQAAELVVPDARARQNQLAQITVRLRRAMRGRVAEERAGLGALRRRLGDPRLMLAELQQTQDDRAARLESVAARRVRGAEGALTALGQRLALSHPRAVVLRERAELHRTRDHLVAHTMRRLATSAAARSRAGDRLVALGARLLDRDRAAVAGAAARLHAMSPLAVLGRGYAIATDARGRAVRSGADVATGDRIFVRVHNAQIVTDVVAVDEESGK